MPATAEASEASKRALLWCDGGGVGEWVRVSERAGGGGEGTHVCPEGVVERVELLLLQAPPVGEGELGAGHGLPCAGGFGTQAELGEGVRVPADGRGRGRGQGRRGRRGAVGVYDGAEVGQRVRWADEVANGSCGAQKARMGARESEREARRSRADRRKHDICAMIVPCATLFVGRRKRR